jgi:glycosyltransferase involved in cell wall biosynthesis
MPPKYVLSFESQFACESAAIKRTHITNTNEDKMSALVSIIIPVYNKLKFLPDCIASVKNQSYRNWECVFVDDGSSDGSSSYLQQLCLEDQRLRLLSQTNQGVGLARNTGMSAIKGDFFCFIDADDIVSPHYITVLLDAYEKTQCSLIISDYESKSSDLVMSSFNIADIVEQVSLDSKNICHNLKSVHTGPWGKLYNKKVFKELQFPNLRGAEDIYAHADIIQVAGTLAIITNKLYYWRQESTSTSHATSFDNRLIYIDALAQCVWHWLFVMITASCPTYQIRRIIQDRLRVLIGYVVRALWYDKSLSVAQKRQLVESLRVGLLQIKNDLKNNFVGVCFFFGRWLVLSFFIKSSNRFRLGFTVNKVCYYACKLVLGRKI